MNPDTPFGTHADNGASTGQTLSNEAFLDDVPGTPEGVSFVADDVKRLIGIVRSIPSGLALAFGQNTKARGFDFDREVVDSIMRDFHLDFETPHVETPG